MTFFLSCISAIFYRMGGYGKPFKSWMRDWLIPLVAIISVLFVLKLKVPGYIHLISYGLLGASLTTYYDNSKNPIKDMLARLINWMYPEDNFYLHGLFIGLAYFPYAIITGCWLMLIARSVILAVFMGGLNYIVNKYKLRYSVWIEELGRGFAIIATLQILLR